MGDHRLNVEITVIGKDSKEYKIDWWVNWTEDCPKRIFDEMVKMAEKAGLPVNPFYD